MVVGIGASIDSRGHPLYVMWALGWGGRALRAVKYASYAGKFAALLQMSDNCLSNLLIFYNNFYVLGGLRCSKNGLEFSTCPTTWLHPWLSYETILVQLLT